MENGCVDISTRILFSTTNGCIVNAEDHVNARKSSAIFGLSNGSNLPQERLRMPLVMLFQLCEESCHAFVENIWQLKVDQMPCVELP